jgi:hypothetical protein
MTTMLMMIHNTTMQRRVPAPGVLAKFTVVVPHISPISLGGHTKPEPEDGVGDRPTEDEDKGNTEE